MNKFRFILLDGYPKQGIVMARRGKPTLAEFLTPEAAKALQQSKSRAA